MRRLFRCFSLCALLLLTACSNIWAQVFSGRMADSLLAMESYRGQLQQRGLLPDEPQTPVVQDVLFAKPWRVRAEVLSPEALKGTLFLYDGEQMLMWWPQELFGLRVRGLKNPSRAELVAHIEREMQNAMENYAFSLTPGQKVAGHPVARWRVIPLNNAPYRLQHTSFVYEPYALPLKMEFLENGKPWYSYEFSKLDFGVPVAADAFSFSFPENAVVFDWDMRDEGISLETARRQMNFTVMQPTKLPSGMSLRKIVRSRHCLPMIAMQYDHDGSVLSLTQSRALTSTLPRFGKAVKIGGRTAWLYFAGSYSVLSWVQEKTQLTLISNLSFPQLIAVAASVSASAR